MSVIRQANILGQQRVDVPHLRALESSISADFDLLAGQILSGGRSAVVKGFEIVTGTGIGSPAPSLELVVASSIILHPLATEAGTIFSVPSDTDPETLSSTNSKVIGSFTANQVNYVSIDLRREADDTTSDLVMFLDANSLRETPKTVPLARTLQYRIVISTADFSSTPTLLPIAKVTTNSTNIVTLIEDARPMLYRLGTGGSVPDRHASYSWSGGRSENTSGSVFTGGDKALTSFKDFSDAVFTRLWELGGGEYWYSPTSDRELKLLYTSSVIPATQDNFRWTLFGSTLEWAGLAIAFGNSTVHTNTITDGSAVLADGQCLYVDIDRTTVAATVPAVADLQTLGSPDVPGSRFVIAWRIGDDVHVKDKPYEVGRIFPVASPIVLGTVALKEAAVIPTQPVVLAEKTGGQFENTASGSNKSAFKGTGNGTGPGLEGVGGNSNGDGVNGTGIGSGSGLVAVGGDTGGPGITAQGGPGAQARGLNCYSSVLGGIAAYFESYIIGSAIEAHGADAGIVAYGSNGIGVQAFGSGGVAGVEGNADGTGYGVIGNGGDTNGSVGVYGTSTATNGIGVWGQGSGTSTGVKGSGGGSDGVGVTGTGGATNGRGGLFTGSGNGLGLQATGGASGGTGLHASGGSAAGLGAIITGGTSSAGALGNGTGLYVKGADVNGLGSSGTAIIAVGGNTGTAGVAVDATGGTGGGIGGKFSNGIAATAAVRKVAVYAVNGDILLGAVNPNSDAAFTNTVTPSNTIKARGTLGLGGIPFTITIQEGFNIGTPTRLGDSTFRVPFQSSFGGGGNTYTVVATCYQGNTPYFPMITKTASHMDVNFTNLGNTTETIDGAFTSFVFEFIIVGNQ